MAQRKALGRGLSALMGAPEAEPDQLREVDVDRIQPNAQQPRKSFDDNSLSELAESIKAHGVIQPIVVQPMVNGQYRLVAGERRWRAAQRAGLPRIPAIVREITDNRALEVALIENIQREDLNPIEEAQAYDRLIEEFGLTQEQVAQRVGKSRATITNMLRLLRLPAEVQQWIAEGKLTTGHAKALLALPDRSAMLDQAKKILQGNYSVRQAEMLVSRYGKDSSVTANRDAGPAPDPNVKAAIHALERAVGSKVTIQESGGKGRIELHFFSFEEMNRLYEGLLRANF